MRVWGDDKLGIRRSMHPRYGDQGAVGTGGFSAGIRYSTLYVSRLKVIRLITQLGKWGKNVPHNVNSHTQKTVEFKLANAKFWPFLEAFQYMCMQHTWQTCFVLDCMCRTFTTWSLIWTYKQVSIMDEYFILIQQYKSPIYTF